MKRSEMLDIICSVVKVTRNKDWTNDEVSSKILEEIENVGMSPPPKPIFGDVIIREWEQEDE